MSLDSEEGGRVGGYNGTASKDTVVLSRNSSAHQI